MDDNHQLQITQFSIPCNFGGQVVNVTIYVGSPKEDQNPIYFQTKFLQDMKGGAVPGDIIESLNKLHELAKKYGVPVAELCYHALQNNSDLESPDISSGAKSIAEQQPKINVEKERGVLKISNVNEDDNNKRDKEPKNVTVEEKKKTKNEEVTQTKTGDNKTKNADVGDKSIA